MKKTKTAIRRRTDHASSAPRSKSRELAGAMAELQIERAELEAQNDALRRAQRELEESRDLYSDLFDFAPVPYINLSQKGLLLGFNLAAATLLKLSRLSFSRLPLVTLIDPEHQSRFWDHLARCGRGSMQLSTELDLRLRSGERIPVQMVTAPPNRSDVAMFRTTIIDLRTQKLADDQRAQLIRESARREEAERDNRAKDVFFSVLAHELRTPLNAVHGWSQLLAGGQLSEADTRHAIQVIERNVKLQVRIINDMLDLSRILRGTLELRDDVVNLLKLVRGAIDSVERLAGDKEIGIECHLDPIAGLVPGDADRLTQVVTNLLGNAIKFTPRGGWVEVRLNRVVPVRPMSLDRPHEEFAWDESVRLTITDTGVGIAPDELPHVFESFWSGKRAMDGPTGGLGLGLAIARRLVELHGGSLEASSPGVDRGTTVVVELPIARRAPREARTEVPVEVGDEDLDLEGVNVLLVDDDRDSREVLKRLLEPTGARFVVVESAAAGFDAVRSLRPDVILSDLAMPEEDGYSLIRRVRELPGEEGGQTPAIALSAYVGSGNEGEAIEAGYQRFVAKPADPEQLRSLIGELVRVNGRGAGPPATRSPRRSRDSARVR